MPKKIRNYARSSRERRLLEGALVQPARHVPPQITPQCLGRVPVRESLQGLEHQHSGDHVDRHRRATEGQGKQVSEQRAGNCARR